MLKWASHITWCLSFIHFSHFILLFKNHPSKLDQTWMVPFQGVFYDLAFYFCFYTVDLQRDMHYTDFIVQRWRPRFWLVEK